MKITVNRINRFLIGIFFVLLATVPNQFTIEGKNLLLLGFSVFGIVLLTIINFKHFPNFQNRLVLIILSYLVFSWMLNSKSSQLLSLIYSTFFIISFVFYSSFARQNLEVQHYRTLLKTIFLLYFLGLLVGQIYIGAGMFTQIEGISGFVKGHFGTILEDDGFRYYSFSSEPSYASFIVILLYYSYILLDEKRGSLFKGENLFLFLILVYMIFFFRSGYGVILFAVLMVNYMGLTKTSVVFYAIGFTLFIAFLFFGKALLSLGEFIPLQRVVNVITQIDLQNPRSLFLADFNTYFRIVPIFYYFETASLSDWHLYFGHGASSSKYFIVPSIHSAYINGEYLGGFLPAFFYDYGVIGAGLVMLFVFRLLPRLISVSTVIVVLVLTNANMNTQLFWLIIMCLTMNQYYLRFNARNEVGQKNKLLTTKSIIDSTFLRIK